MNGKAHRLTGVIVGATYGAVSPWPAMALPCAAIAACAALAPDLDTRKSIATTFVNRTIILRPLRWFAALISGGPDNHRATTHWLPLWAVLGYGAVYGLHPVWWAHMALTAFAGGYLLHLAEDAMTIDGIPVVRLWVVPLLRLPLLVPGGHWHILPPKVRFPSGAPKREKIAVGLILLGCAVVVSDHYSPQAHAAYMVAVAHLAHGIHAAVVSL